MSRTGGENALIRGMEQISENRQEGGSVREMNEVGVVAMRRPASVAESRVWTVDEAACLLGISRAHAYELVARNELPHVRLGRRIVVPKRAVEQLLAQAYE